MFPCGLVRLGALWAAAVDARSNLSVLLTAIFPPEKKEKKEGKKKKDGKKRGPNLVFLLVPTLYYFPFFSPLFVCKGGGWCFAVSGGQCCCRAREH
jgi:hypothetical protein